MDVGAVPATPPSLPPPVALSPPLPPDAVNVPPAPPPPLVGTSPALQAPAAVGFAPAPTKAVVYGAVAPRWLAASSLPVMSIAPVATSTRGLEPFTCTVVLTLMVAAETTQSPSAPRSTASQFDATSVSYGSVSVLVPVGWLAKHGFTSPFVEPTQ